MVIPIAKGQWFPVYNEGESEEWGDEPAHWTRRFVPYAAQAAEALQEQFMFTNTCASAQGPQVPRG